MKDKKEIRDDEIRIIGNDTTHPQPSVRQLWGWVAFGLTAVALTVVWLLAVRNAREATQPDAETYFESGDHRSPIPKRLGREADSLARGFTDVCDTTINDIPLRIYIPYNTEMTLHVGRLDKRDITIIYVVQAADIRRDIRKIVGAFVLRGEPLAWGALKKGLLCCDRRQNYRRLGGQFPAFRGGD